MTDRTVLDYRPSPVDLLFERGDGEVAEFVMTKADDTVIDVSAYTWTAQFRARKGAADAVDFDVDVSDAAEGIVRVNATAEILAAMLEIGDRGVWDLQAQLSGSDPQTPLGGNVFIDLDVTV